MQEKDKKSNGSVIRIHPWETKMLTFTMFIDWNRLVNHQFWNSCGYTCTRSKEKKEQGQVQESSKYFLKIRLCLVWYWYPCKLQQSWAWQNLKSYWKTNTGKEKNWKSTNVCRSYLQTCTDHTAHLGHMAGADLQVTPIDVSKFSNFFLSCVIFPLYY